jgi:hypothetical protein
MERKCNPNESISINKLYILAELESLRLVECTFSSSRDSTMQYLSNCVIRLKRIYNFWCSMLVLHQLLCVLFTLRDIFIHFLELTYWWDGTVPVPCFLLFLCFRKVTQEIFSELDETKPEVPIFPQHETESKEESEGGQGQPHHLVARVTPRARHPMVWGPWPPSDIAPLPIRSLRRENPKSVGVFPRKVSQRRDTSILHHYFIS